MYIYCIYIYIYMILEDSRNMCATVDAYVGLIRIHSPQCINM